MDDNDGFAAPSALTPARVLLILRRQWWVIIACMVLAAAGGFAYTRAQVTRYAATATVQVSPLGAVPSGTTAPPLPNPATEIKDRDVRMAATRAGGAVDLVAATGNAGTAIDITATGRQGPAASRAALAAARAFAAQRVKDIEAQAAAYGARVSIITRQLDGIDPGAGTKLSPAVAARVASLKTVLGVQSSVQESLQVAADSVTLSTATAPPFTTLTSSRSKVLEVALVAGLLVGCGIALISEQLDDRLRSATELAEVANVGLLAELPTRSTGGRAGSIASNPHDELSEAVRELRTALRFLSVERPLRTLLVTSPAAGEGKSFVAANLAVAFALSGVRTVLVSSDLRRPTLERLFGAPASSLGLSDAIADAALRGRPTWITPGGGEAAYPPVDVGHLLQSTGVDDLFLLPAGASPPNPAELLGSVHMASVLEDLGARADMVILDSPPVLAVTDALVLTAHADGVILVVSKGKSSRGAIRRALRLLESGLAPVSGVVLNRSAREDLVPYPYFEGPEGPRTGGLRRLRPRRPDHVAARRPGDSERVARSR